MRTTSLDRVLAAGVIAIAAFHVLAAAALPIPERRPGTALLALSAALLLAHAALYWFGRAARERAGVVPYLVAQAALVFALGLAGALFPVGLGLYVALTAQAVILSGGTTRTFAITLGAVALFAANAMLVQDLYRGASAGLVLAVTGVASHAVAATLRRRADAALVERPQPAGETTGLTARELEVLRALDAGMRNGEIAGSLSIAERTVKAHLASVYQKLGVASRGAAVAAARARGLLR